MLYIGIQEYAVLALDHILLCLFGGSSTLALLVS